MGNEKYLEVNDIVYKELVLYLSDKGNRLDKGTFTAILQATRNVLLDDVSIRYACGIAGMCHHSSDGEHIETDTIKKDVTLLVERIRGKYEDFHKPNKETVKTTK